MFSHAVPFHLPQTPSDTCVRVEGVGHGAAEGSGCVCGSVVSRRGSGGMRSAETP